MELVLKPFVLTEEIANFPSAYANIASGNVRIRVDMAEEFGHEALAEAHYF